jgi:hypothetical protein
MEGVDAAIERSIACVEAGADAIFAEAAYDLPTYRKFVEAVKVPVLANITEFGKTPLFTRDELASAGVAIHCSRCRPSAPPTRRPKRCTKRSAATAASRPCWTPCRPARAVRPHRLPRLRAAAGRAVCRQGRMIGAIHPREFPS